MSTIDIHNAEKAKAQSRQGFEQNSEQNSEQNNDQSNQQNMQQLQPVLRIRIRLDPFHFGQPDPDPLQ